MKTNQPILIYLLAFLTLSILLKFFNVIDFDTSEILGYALIFYGISQVYIYFGSQRKVKLFLGTFIFLLGLFLFLINNFEFSKISQLLIPAGFFIISICFFMVSISGFFDKSLLILSIIFFISGLVYTLYFGTLKFITFLNSILTISLKYWSIILIVFGIIFLINRSKK